MKRHFLYLIFSVALLAAGCSLAPDYQRPEAPVDAGWPQGPAYSANASPATAADLPWREFFTDKGLQQVIEKALENNRDLRLAALNVEGARATYGIQKAAIWPSLDATAASAHQRIPADLSSTGKVSKPEQYSVDFGAAAWEIDFFGRIQNLKDQALEAYLATEQARRSARIVLIATVGQAYLALAAGREQLALSRSTLTAQEETYGLIRRRVETGLASRLDLRLAQTQVETARGDVARLVQQVAQDENALNLLVGTGTVVSGALLPETLTGLSPLQEISAGVSSEVLLNRPDILAQEHQLKAANANIGAARAAFFPRVVLTARAGTASSELSRLFDSGQGTWTFAPSISVPIFDARLWSAYDLTQVEKEVALTRYEKTIQTAFREVADALAARGGLKDRLEASLSLVDALDEAHRLSQIRYDKGIDSYLSVLDAQRSLYAARQGVLAIRLADLANQIQLYAVLGGGVGE